MKRSKLILLFALVFLLSITNIRISKEMVFSNTTLYDFVANASKATWQSGAGTLPFPGSSSDSRGFAILLTNTVTEDNITYSKVLEAHPEWKDKVGYISGIYPELMIPQGAKLELKIGFLKGATGTDGVRYRVLFDIGQPTIIFERSKKYTNSLDSATVDLSNYQGQKGKFILYVSVYATSTQDWACWVDAKVTIPGTPDLVITDTWVDSSRYVHYKVRNIGDGSASSLTAAITNTLYINNTTKATDAFTRTINPGEEYESYFKNFIYPYPQVNETLKVCADTGNSIKESNEQNNCKEKVETAILGGIKVDTGCSQVKVEIFNEKGQFVQSGVSDSGNYYSTGLTLIPGSYKIIPSKEGCSFEPKERIVTVSINQSASASFSCSCKKGPDLVITEINYASLEGTIQYRIKNIGDDRTNAYFKNSLYIDSVYISEDSLNVYLNPGEEALRKFAYSYNPRPPLDIIKVCADYKDQVKEFDESNNCLETKKHFPDLIVITIECDFTGKVARYTIKNAGEEKVEKPFDVAVYVDGALKDTQSISNAINPGETYSSSFAGYITPCTNLKVKIIVDSGGKIIESSENNNYLEKECVCSETPDLLVTSASLVDKQICYTVKNSGKKDISSNSFYNVLLVDGRQVSEDRVDQSLASTQQLTRCFNYEMPAGRHSVKICADSRQNVKETNENNNCLEQVFNIEENLPDLVVESIQCVGENIVSFTVRNSSFDFQSTSWTSSAEIYFDGLRKGTVNLKVPSSTSGGGIEKANGNSTYVTEWNVSASTKVKVIIDAANSVKETNESNNSKESTVDPCVVKLPDLIITEIITEGSSVYYKIKNIGEGVAGYRNTGATTAQEKVTPCSALYFDSVKVSDHCLDNPLEPGQEVQGYFKYELKITPPDDVLRVCADWENRIKEADENNNCIERIIPSEQILPNKPCGCFETDHFEARVTGYDGFAVGNVFGGPEAEIITVVDEDAPGDNGRFYIYTYNGDLLLTFDARFTKNDRIITGDLWGDSLQEEIAVVIDEDDKVYIYDSSGSLLHSFEAKFTPFDTFASGNIQGDEKDEIIIAIDEDDKVYVYTNQGTKLFEFDIFWNFNGANNLGDKSDHNDAMAVGNVFGDKYAEILLLDQNGDKSLVYIYNVINGSLWLKATLMVRFTKYDIFTTGDVLGNEREEIIIAIDEDHMIYIYDAMTGLLKCRYADITPVDAIASGNLFGGSKEEIAVAQDDDHLIFIASEEP